MNFRSLLTISLLLASASAFAQNLSTPTVQNGDWFTAEKEFVLKPSDAMGTDGRTMGDLIGRDYKILRGTDINIVNIDEANKKAEIAFNNEGQDPLNTEKLPFSLTVDLRDINPALLSKIQFDESDEFPDDDDEQITGVDQILEVARGKRRAVRSRSGVTRPRVARGGSTAGRVIRVYGRGGMTMCLAEVRVNAKSICGQTMPTIGRAAQGYEVYKAAGWRPVEYSPNSNPVCTACFWGGGRTDCGGQACGHAALKIRAGAWIGAGIRTPPELPNQNGCKRSVRGKKVCRVPYVRHGCLVAPGH
ncbi:MAG: hypothetical protein KF681_00550 [Bdellovibrionaceae bacterium]|nr:hypothetical protein [Pseudobdellovibrionaceae bacterium]